MLVFVLSCFAISLSYYRLMKDALPLGFLAAPDFPGLYAAAPAPIDATATLAICMPRPFLLAWVLLISLCASCILDCASLSPVSAVKAVASTSASLSEIIFPYRAT